MAEFDWIDDGGVTSPAGFRAGGVYTGIKRYGDEPRLDLGLLAWGSPTRVAGVFTTNAVVGESVLWNRALVAGGKGAGALVVNSGNANTVTGEQGARDCRRIAELAASKVGLQPEEVLVGSTGVIGRLLPMDLVEQGIRSVELAEDGGARFARAIMTTDTHPKECALRVKIGGRDYVVGGCAKGSGMIHPNMATMFAFLTTDAPVGGAWLQATLRSVVDRTFNMVDVDMDTSTSDMGLLISSGAGGGQVVDGSHPDEERLREGIQAVATRLARAIARDGEGARALLEAVAEGAASVEDARRAARTIVSSPLVKTMVVGRDPNWGRVMMAAGRSGARVDQRRASVWIGEHCVLEGGTPTPVDLALVSRAMAAEEVRIRIDLGTGGVGTATAWGCDLTEDYVRINADYTT
ncbi:MAG: bifunctional glutamate N-acetyltransferase/amino-acid acetyltransferase ArgJ [Chloroflexi bacterium]|nr:bifunctional glutamate N-acetyltransferase/amino-acid acetyltransferase ArgJ [Chloroflexota bacterium]